MVHLLLLPVLASAQDVVPERFQGRYIGAEMAESIVSLGEPKGGHQGRLTEIGPTHMMADMILDSTELEFTNPRRVGQTLIVDGSEGYEGAAVDEYHFEMDGEVATYGFKKAGDAVRLEDVAAAAGFASDDGIYSGMVFSLGWIDEEHPWVFLMEPSDPFERDLGYTLTMWDGTKTVNTPGGFGFIDSIVVDGVEYGIDYAPGSDVMRFWEAREPDGPDLEPLDGGREIELSRTEEPPFVLLASRLNLRTQPTTSGKKVASIGGGPPVRVWGRTSASVRIGKQKARWYLVQAQGAFGWGFGPYIGRRLLPSAPDERGLTVVRSEVWSDERRIVYGEKDGRSQCRAVAGRRQAESADFPTQAARVMAFVSDVGSDGQLDVVCAAHHGDHVTLCPLIWPADGSVWTQTGCVHAPRTVESWPAFWFGDTNDDGHDDLQIDVSEPPMVARWDDSAKAFVGSWSPPAADVTVEPTGGLEPDAATDAGLCACSTVAFTGVPLGWWLGLLSIRRSGAR